MDLADLQCLYCFEKLPSCKCQPLDKSFSVDLVNSPPHYTQGSIEVIDAIEGLGLDYLRGCALKYIARAPYKGAAVQDIEKAMWYLRRWAKKYG